MAHSRCSSCEMGGVQIINFKKKTTTCFYKVWGHCVSTKQGKDGNNCRGIKIRLFGRTISAVWGQVTGHNRSVTSPINTHCTNCLQPSHSSSFNYILTFFLFMTFCFLPVYPWFYGLSCHNSFTFAKSEDIKKARNFNTVIEIKSWKNPFLESLKDSKYLRIQSVLKYMQWIFHPFLTCLCTFQIFNYDKWIL